MDGLAPATEGPARLSWLQLEVQGGCAIGARKPRQVRKEATVLGKPM